MSRYPYIITEARTTLVVQQSFFASILFERGLLEVTEDGVWRGMSLPTAMTDGRHIVVNLEFFESLNLHQRMFVLCHEVFHLFSKHPTRFKYYHQNGLFGRKFDYKVANICADVVINKCLRDADIGQMPPDGVGEQMEQQLKERFNYTVTGKEAWEDIYKLILDDSPDQNQGQGQGQGEGDDEGQCSGQGQGQGQGQGYAPDNYTPDVGDTATAEGQIPSDQEMKASVSSAASAAKSRGQLPANLTSLIDEFLEPVVDWREELATAITHRAGSDSYNWRKPNKRRLVNPGIYVPRKQGMRVGEVVVAVDTSGSMSDGDLRAVLSETSAILSSVNPEKVHVIWCDAVIERVDEIDTAEELLDLTRSEGVPGRGGTRFDPPFQYIIDNGIDAQFMIYMTDGMAPDVSDDLIVTDTIWCIVGPHRTEMANGRTVNIPSSS